MKNEELPILEGMKFYINPYLTKRIFGRIHQRTIHDIQENIKKLGGRIIFLRRKGTYCIYDEQSITWMKKHKQYRDEIEKYKLNLIAFEQLDDFVEEQKKLYFLTNLK